MSRIVRVIVHHVLDVDVDKFRDECDSDENLDLPDPSDDDARWAVEGFFDTRVCIPRWARDGVQVVTND